MDKDRIGQVDERYRLWWLLARTRDTILRARQNELRENGISHSEAAVLFIIDILGGTATLEEISMWGFRKGHSISDLVSRMETGGLVRKVRESKRENIRVEMTDKGKQAHRLASKGQVICKIFSSLSKQEQKILSSCLHKLRNEALEVLGIYRVAPWP